MGISVKKQYYPSNSVTCSIDIDVECSTAIMNSGVSKWDGESNEDVSVFWYGCKSKEQRLWIG